MVLNAFTVNAVTVDYGIGRNVIYRRLVTALYPPGTSTPARARREAEERHQATELETMKVSVVLNGVYGESEQKNIASTDLITITDIMVHDEETMENVTVSIADVVMPT